MNNVSVTEKEMLHDLAHRHEDVLTRLDELDNTICGVINEFLGKMDKKKDAAETLSVTP